MKLFLRQLSGEIWKMFARKRTHVGFVMFLLLEVAILICLRMPFGKSGFLTIALQRNGYNAADFFTGPTVCFNVVWASTFLLGALFLALVAGDVVAKEAEDGTLRMILCRPVSRVRVLLLKYIACIVYTFFLIFFIFLSSLAMGVMYRGFGNLFVWDPALSIFGVFGEWEGLRLLAWSAVLLSCCMCTVTSLGFMLSCFDIKPATATIITLSLLFSDFVFKQIPFFESYHPYLLTTNIAVWARVFGDSTQWAPIVPALVYLAAFNLTFLIIGGLHFCQRDFKS